MRSGGMRWMSLGLAPSSSSRRWRRRSLGSRSRRYPSLSEVSRRWAASFSAAEALWTRSGWSSAERARNFFLRVSGSSQGRRGSPNSEKRSVTSGAEAFAARAACGCVGILNFEAAVEAVEVIQLAAGNVEGAFGVHYDADPGGFDEDVAIGGGVLKVHFLFETGATASDDSDAKDAVRAALLSQQSGYFMGGAGGELDKTFVADAEARRGGLFWGDIGDHR